jgi:hypothetical protein
VHEDVRRIIAKCDASHPQECPVDKRRREIREAEREQKAREAMRRREEEQRQASNNQWWAAIDQRIGRAARHKEVKAAVEEAQRAVKAKLEALEQRIGQHIEQCSGRPDALGEVTATERADRRTEVKAAVEEAQRAVEAKLEGKFEALELRLKAVPGKLPVARIWHPESVTYQSEFVSHEGALYQAKKDTAQIRAVPIGFASRVRAAMGWRRRSVAPTMSMKVIKCWTSLRWTALHSLPNTMIRASVPGMAGNF